MLKRRVQMQRELITKMSKLSEEHKEKAEEKRIDVRIVFKRYRLWVFISVPFRRM